MTKRLKIVLLISGLTLLIYFISRNKKIGSLNQDSFISPLSGRYTSFFGEKRGIYTHNGLDIAAPFDSVIVAPQNGVVTAKYYNSSGGNQLIITHNFGIITGYAHLNKYFVNKGDSVKKGQAIGTVGTTGNTTGPHLHLTFTENGFKQNPLNYIS